MIKAVLFDMDGLMLDTEIILQKFWCEAAQFYGYDMTKEIELGMRSLSKRYALKYLKKVFGENFDYMAVRSKRIEMMNEYISQHGMAKKKGLDELLDYIKSTPLKAAVCTATDFERMKMYLEQVGVMDKFDKFICSNMVARGKPAPDIYEYACQQIGFAPEECIALEDSPNGVISAAIAGLNVIMIPDLTQPSADITPFLYVKCESLDEVIDILKSLLRENE